LLLVSLLAPVVHAALNPLAPSPWPTYGQNPQRNNRSSYIGPQQMPVEKWRFTRINDHWGTDYRGTAVGPGNTVFLSAGMAGVYAIDSATGLRRWLSSPENTGHETFVEFPPTVAADGTLYMDSENDYAYALSPSGQVLWSFLSNHLHTPSSISPDGSTVHFTSESGDIYALNRTTGAKLWSYRLAQYGQYATGRRIPIVYDDAGNLYFSWLTTVWSLTPGGTLRWSLPIANLNGILQGPAVGSDGSLYFTAADSLVSVSMAGQLRWRQQLGASAFDRTPAIGPDGTIYIGADDGFVYAFSSGGGLLWKQQYVEKPGWAAFKTNILVDANGTLFFASNKGKVYGVDSQSRQLLWTYSTSQDNNSYPGMQISLDADGTLYVPVSGRLLLALAPVAGQATLTPTVTTTAATSTLTATVETVATATETPTATTTATAAITATATPTTTATATSIATATQTASPTPSQTSTRTSTPTTGPSGGNVLLNGGFETSSSGVTPDAWLLSNGAPSNVVTRNGLQHSDGSYALRANSNGGQSFTVYQDLSVNPGERYSFSGGINVPTSTGSFNASVQLQALNQYGGTVGSATTAGAAQTTTTAGWVATNGSFTVPNGATTLRVQLRLTTLKADVYVDGFTLTRVP